MEFIIWFGYLPLVIFFYSLLARLVLKDNTAQSFLAIAFSSFLTASTLELAVNLSAFKIALLYVLLNVVLFILFRRHFTDLATKWLALLVVASNGMLILWTIKHGAHIAVLTLALQIFFLFAVHKLAKMPTTYGTLGVFAASAISAGAIIMFIAQRIAGLLI